MCPGGGNSIRWKGGSDRTLGTSLLLRSRRGPLRGRRLVLGRRRASYGLLRSWGGAPGAEREESSHRAKDYGMQPNGLLPTT